MGTSILGKESFLYDLAISDILIWNIWMALWMFVPTFFIMNDQLRMLYLTRPSSLKLKKKIDHKNVFCREMIIYYNCPTNNNSHNFLNSDYSVQRKTFEENMTNTSSTYELD